MELSVRTALPRRAYHLRWQNAETYQLFFAAVHPRFRTPYISILVFAFLVWTLALFGSFAANATLSAAARLFLFGLVCAALPVLRKNQFEAAGFRLPGGPFFAGLGVLICFTLLAFSGLSNSLVLLAVMALALLNWAVVRTRKTTRTYAS
jgi:amino acid transporter